ncbi:MAG: aldolase/citrate lyase family protein [Thermomicrobiales bacterium]
MRENTAKAKMLNGKPAFGYALGLGSVRAAEMLAYSGIDWILLDTQHGSFGIDQINQTFAVMRHSPAIPMARAARNDYTLIGRLLDEGEMGIVVPMVENAGDAQQAADACLHPPRGKRSFGWGGAGLYGADYPDWINQEIFVAVQLESITAVENAEAIMSIEGIDGCWAGPADLALSIGVDPRNAGESERHAEALQEIVRACKAVGKIPGIAAASPEDAASRAEQGFQFITAGGDAGFMMGGATAGLKTLGLA